MHRQRALLIGGVIDGLAAAIGLKKIGYGVEVYEQAPEPREVGAGLTLWSNAVRALKHPSALEMYNQLPIKNEVDLCNALTVQALGRFLQ